MVPEGWDATILGDCVSIRSGSTPSKQRVDFWGGSIPWISAKDLKLHRIRNAQLHLTERGVVTAKLAEENSILVLVRGMTLLKDVPIGLVTRPVAFNQDIKALVASPNADPEFLSYMLVGKKRVLMGLVNTANHGTGRLDTELLRALPVHLPPLPEQRKIAEILSTWDRAIETTEKLLANARSQKRALMQILLTGKRRFPEFEGLEWREVRLGDVFTERSERGGDELPLLAITSARGVIPQTETDRRDTSREDKSSYKQIHVGDIGYNSMRMWQGVSALSGLTGLISPAYTVVVPTRKINARFAAHLFKLPKQVHFFRRYSQGLTSDTWNLKFKQFSDVPARIPEIREQIKIAATLDLWDEAVRQIENKGSLLRSEKAALMQQLLTGKRRVKV